MTSTHEALAAAHDAVGFDAKAHTYQIDGKSYDAVTSACKMLDKPFLVSAAASLARQGRSHTKEWAEARELGKAVHRTAENVIRKLLGLPSLPEPQTTESGFLASGLRAWMVRARDMGVDFCYPPESRLYHPKYGYAGTMDFPAKWLGVPTIFDLKTCPKASSAYDEWRPQNAAYREAAKYHTGMEWQGAILRVPKDGSEPNILPLGNHGPDFAAFLNLLGLYRWSNGAKAPEPVDGVINATERFMAKGWE